MKAERLIDITIAEWANALRVLGNEGAHYTGNRVSRDDADDALAFAEALLDHIYVLRLRFQEFAERRARLLEDAQGSDENVLFGSSSGVGVHVQDSLLVQYVGIRRTEIGYSL